MSGKYVSCEKSYSRRKLTVEKKTNKPEDNQRGKKREQNIKDIKNIYIIIKTTFEIDTKNCLIHLSAKQSIEKVNNKKDTSTELQRSDVTGQVLPW